MVGLNSLSSSSLPHRDVALLGLVFELRVDDAAHDCESARIRVAAVTALGSRRSRFRRKAAESMERRR